GRLSTLVAGLFLMFQILVLGGLVVQIPMPVLVGIMIMVSIGTFDWSSFKYLVKAPKTDALVMLVTVIIVVATHDLSKGVIAGVILSAIFFVAKISKIEVIRRLSGNETIYEVKGQLFFASVEGFVNKIDYAAVNSNVVIDFTDSHIWDDSGVSAVDKAVIKLRENHNKVTVRGLNASSQKMIDKLAIYHDTNAQLKAH
ncbi:SulP family inorganic anion transporter, partial [Escherichia coli]|nr:SulP family inorganic anion transporter [Escherichia coli]